MNRVGVQQRRSGGRGAGTLVALAFLVLPWVVAARTIDHSTSVRVGAVVLAGPTLAHVPYKQPVRADYPVTLSLSVESSTNPILTATLFYRAAGESVFRGVPLQPPPAGRPAPYRGSAEILPGLSVAAASASYEYYFEIHFGPDPDSFVIAWRPSTGAEDPLATVTTTLSATKSVDGNGGTVILSAGLSSSGNSRVVVPSGALANSSSVSLGLMTSAAEQAAMSVPANGRLPVEGLSLQTKPLAIFKRPVSLYLSYRDLDNDGREDDTGADETLLQPAWFDGIQWRALPRLGIDTAENVLFFNSSLTGYFALLPSYAAPSTQRPQEKIISPNGDGVNDAALFDGLPPGTRVVILDVRGRVVREITDQPVWDGRDHGGNLVESGLYVYQVHSVEGLFSGTITVAR
jgi:hypothetical protein